MNPHGKFLSISVLLRTKSDPVYPGSGAKIRAGFPPSSFLFLFQNERIKAFRACSSAWLERTPDKREVGSSSLPRPTIVRNRKPEIRSQNSGESEFLVSGLWLLISEGAIAQLGERLLCKQEVVGSIPSGSTIANASVKTDGLFAGAGSRPVTGGSTIANAPVKTDGLFAGAGSRPVTDGSANTDLRLQRSFERTGFAGYPGYRTPALGKISSRNIIHREEGDLPEAFLDGTPAGYHPALQLVQKGRLDAIAMTLSLWQWNWACGRPLRIWVDLDYLVLLSGLM